MALTEAQVAERKNALGSSDCAAACGVSPFTTPLQLYHDKVSEVAPLNESLAMRIGNQFERGILDMACEDLGVTGRTNVVRVHKHHKWWRSRLDRQIEIDGVDAPLEAKFGQDSEEWGPTGSDQVPLQYVCQVYHQMLAMDAPRGYLAALLAGSFGKRFEIYEIPRRKDLDELITNGCVEFWDRVERRDPPPGTMPADFVKRIKKTAGSVVAVPGTLIREWDRLKEIEKEAKKAAKDQEEVVLGAMGDAEAVCYYHTDEEDRVELRVRWHRDESGGKRFNKEEFLKAHPEMKQAVADNSPESRRRMWRDKTAQKWGLEEQPLVEKLSVLAQPAEGGEA